MFISKPCCEPDAKCETDCCDTKNRDPEMNKTAIEVTVDHNSQLVSAKQLLAWINAELSEELPLGELSGGGGALALAKIVPVCSKHNCVAPDGSVVDELSTKVK